MKIEKSKLSKALKKIGLFVGKNSINKNASLIHFKNKDNKAMLFATDFASAGRVYFDTDEANEFEFCIDYNQLLQATKIRNKEIEVNIFNNRSDENGLESDGIEFFDDKTKFIWSLHDPIELINIENNTKIPETPYFELDAKTFKNALREAGYARNEKDSQNLYVVGVNFQTDGTMVEFSSTDRQRIACWKSIQESIKELEGNKIEGILSPRNVNSVSLFDDDEKIKIYIDDAKIVLVSDSFEAYATKIQCAFPDLNKFFEKDIVSSFEIVNKDVIESLSIVDGIKTKSMHLLFNDNNVKLIVKSEFGDTIEDYFSCTKINGNNEEIWIAPELFMDIFKNVISEKIIIEFRDMGNNFKIISYKTEDGSYGMLAPQRK